MGEPGDDGAELIHILKLAGTAAALTAAVVIAGGQTLAPALFAPDDAPETGLIQLAGG